MSRPLKIALVHDWLTGMRGGEKVLEVFCELLPSADIFTLVHVPGSVSRTIESRRIAESWLGKLPAARKRYRHYLPLMPLAAETLDLSGYDLVISTSHCVAKGVRPAAGAVHLCCCFTPMRYIWDQYDHYFGKDSSASLPIRSAMRLLRPFLQAWDRKSSERVTSFIAISKFVAERIRLYYGRESAVIYPHADTEFYHPSPDPSPSGSYLIVSAFAPYKKLDLAVQAFNELGLPLKIIGSGQDERRLKAMAGPGIEFLGWRSDEELRNHFQRCRGLVFPGIEDYGIVPIEAMACGRPVIAFGEGGALETVVEGRTGVFFREPTVRSLKEAVRKAEGTAWDPQAIRCHAESFGRARYLRELKDFLLRETRNRIDLTPYIS